MSDFKQMTALECAQYALDEFGHGGRAIGVRDAGPLAITIERAGGRCDVGASGLIAVEIKKRLDLEKNPEKSLTH